MNLDVLIAEREIQGQIIRFARAMDARDWDAIEAIATDKLRADFGTGEIQGRSAVIEFIRSFLDGCGVTQHLVGNFIIEIAGNTARSESYVSDMHLSKDPDQDISFRTLGNYSDSWEKVGGVWRMTHRVKDNSAVMGSFDVFDSKGL